MSFGVLFEIGGDDDDDDGDDDDDDNDITFLRTCVLVCWYVAMNMPNECKVFINWG